MPTTAATVILRLMAIVARGVTAKRPCLATEYFFQVLSLSEDFNPFNSLQPSAAGSQKRHLSFEPLELKDLPLLRRGVMDECDDNKVFICLVSLWCLRTISLEFEKINYLLV